VSTLSRCADTKVATSERWQLTGCRLPLRCGRIFRVAHIDTRVPGGSF